MLTDSSKVADTTVDPKTRIVEAAIAEFVRCGYYGTSVASIVKASGTRSNTLHHHFGSKANCAAHCLLYSIKILRRTVSAEHQHLNSGRDPALCIDHLGTDLRALVQGGEVWYLDGDPPWCADIKVDLLEKWRSARSQFVSATLEFLNSCAKKRQRSVPRWDSGAQRSICELALHWWLTRDVSAGYETGPRGDVMTDVILQSMGQ